MKARTKDERFMIALYEKLEKLDDFSLSLDKYEIGNSIGLNPKAVDAISKELIRSNFIKKVMDEEVVLTAQGKRLVESLRNG